MVRLEIEPKYYTLPNFHLKKYFYILKMAASSMDRMKLTAWGAFTRCIFTTQKKTFMRSLWKNSCKNVQWQAFKTEGKNTNRFLWGQRTEWCVVKTLSKWSTSEIVITLQYFIKYKTDEIM